MTLVTDEYHLTLTDGTTQVGFVFCDGNGQKMPRGITMDQLQSTALKISSGEGTYDDEESPYAKLAQTDFSGGQGALYWDDDHSKFFRNMNLVCKRDYAKLSPRDYLTFGYKSFDYTASFLTYNNLHYTDLYGATRYLATKFTATANTTTLDVVVQVLAIGSPAGLRAALYSDNAGTPDSLVADIESISFSGVIELPIGGYYTVEFDVVGFGVVLGTAYHLVVYPTSDGTATNHWKIGTMTASNDAKKSTNGTSWTTHTESIAFWATDTQKKIKPFFFEYKRAWYMLKSYDDGTAPELYVNGDAGVATSGSSNTLVDTTKSAIWTVNQFAGCVCLLVEGTGSAVTHNYRTISSNTTTTLTLDSAWDVNPAAQTVYAILYDDAFRQIVPTNWTTVVTTTVTDVKVHNNLVYICQGDTAATGKYLSRLRMYNNAGTWTMTVVADGTNTAGYVKPITQNGTSVIWKATYGTPSSIAKATAVAETGGNLSFATAMSCGDTGEKVTGLDTIDDPVKLLVLKEGIPYLVDNDSPTPLPLEEMAVLREVDNGVAHARSGVYNYFNYGGEVSRYYNQLFQGIGPSTDYLDIGAPSSVVAYSKGTLFAAFSGNGIYVIEGETAYNYWKAPWVQYSNARINTLAIQPVIGTGDYLWFNMGELVFRMAIYQRQYSAIDAGLFGYIETPWYANNKRALMKAWKSLTTFAENLSVSNRWFIIEYQLSGDTTWTQLATFVTSNKYESTLSSATPPLTRSERIKFRINFINNGTLYSPILNSSLVKCFSYADVDWGYSFAAIVGDPEINTNLESDDNTLGAYTSVDAAITAMKSWVNNATTLYATSSHIPWLNTKNVVMKSINVRPLISIVDESLTKSILYVSIFDL